MPKKDHLNFDLDFLGEGKKVEAKQPTKAKTALHSSVTKASVSKNVERIPLFVIAGIIVFGIIIFIGKLDADRGNSSYPATNDNSYSNSQVENTQAVYNKQNNEIATPDGSLLFSLPSDWEKTTGMNENAELQLKNGSDNLFTLVFSEKQEDFAASLSQYAKIVADNTLDNLTSAKIVSGPSQLTVDGYPAIQYVLSGVSDAYNVVFMITVIKGETYYHQIAMYTSKSVFEDGRSTLDTILQDIQVRN
jgi:hypothetical protein